MKPLWLKGRDSKPALQLFGADVTEGTIIASCFYAPARLRRSRVLYLDGERYKPTTAVPAGFHNGPVLRAGGKEAPDVLITLERF